MNENEANEIIDFINRKYNESIPNIVKLFLNGKSKKIETVQLEDWPTSFRNCTMEQLIMILKAASQQGKLSF